MNWPEPQPGLVIRYSYLWRREADAGREEGVKDRPCAIVVAVRRAEGQTTVYALPITHRPPANAEDAVALPPETKRRLGLDSERSWIMCNEANVFEWPGPDLRFLPNQGPDCVAYGMLPPGLLRLARDRFLALRTGVVKRTE